MDAPTIVAKGMNLIAQKIKEIAKEHNIPIVEDKPLAQALYKAVEVDQQIPDQLFHAVAQVLAYIYQMKNKTIKRRRKVIWHHHYRYKSTRRPVTQRCDGIGKSGDILLAIAVMAVLGVMIIPLPPFILDILLATNITMSIVLLMVSLY